MKCPICKHGETAPARVTVTLDRAKTTIVFRQVPADVCETCGEQFVSESTTSQLLRQAEEAAKSGIEVEVRPYAA